MKNQLRSALQQHVGALYQTHTWQNEELNEGITCSALRRSFIDLDDVIGKTVLDLGCATGAECTWAIENGARKAFGIDKGTEQIATFRRIIEVIDPNRVRLDCMQYDLSQELPQIADYQTVFCFALLQHIGYWRLYDEIPNAEVIYVESGADSNFRIEDFCTTKWRAGLIGHTPRNRMTPVRERALFRLTRRCRHVWIAGEPYASSISRVECRKCSDKAFAKPRQSSNFPRAAAEHISRRLANLVTRKGIPGIVLPRTEFAHGTVHGQSQKSPWDHSCVIIENLESQYGPSGRANATTEPLTWPAWLYWFDRWIGRSDADGDTNLLYFEHPRNVIPVDFDMAFSWINFIDFPIDNTSMVSKLVPVRDDSVLDVITELTEEEIWRAVFCNVPEDLLSHMTAVGIWAGLCYRAKLLRSFKEPQ